MKETGKEGIRTNSDLFIGTSSLILAITDVSQKFDSSENQTSITAIKATAEIDA